MIGIVGWLPRPRPRLPRVVFRIRRGVETGSPLATVAFPSDKSTRQIRNGIPVESRRPSVAAVGYSACPAPNGGLEVIVQVQLVQK